MKLRCDLHTHSIFSDGAFSPKEIAKMAKQVGIGALSLTDHDTIRGVSEFVKACQTENIMAISGIEFSAIKESEIHIIGYGLNYDDKDVQSRILSLERARIKRNDKILEKLKERGFDVTSKDLYRISQHVVGRSQMGRVMLEKGYVKSVNEAFDKWLSYGKPCFVASHKRPPEEIIALIKEFGGSAVLAHPGRLKSSREDTQKLIAQLKERGLDGIEVHYTSHGKDEVCFFSSLAKKYDLIETAGSDFHDQHRSAKIGHPNYAMDEEILLKLKGKV